MSQLATHLQTLLAGIVADPTSTLAALPLLAEAEQQQLLAPSNGTPGKLSGEDEKRLLDQIDQLSDEQVETLLDEMLAEERGNQ
jgi:hypothetical protein